MHAYLDGGTPVFVAEDVARGHQDERLTEAERIETGLLLRYEGDLPHGYVDEVGEKEWRGDVTAYISTGLRLAARATHTMAYSARESFRKPTETWRERASYAIVHPFAAMRYARARRAFGRILEKELLQDDVKYSELAEKATNLTQVLIDSLHDED